LAGTQKTETVTDIIERNSSQLADVTDLFGGDVPMTGVGNAVVDGPDNSTVGDVLLVGNDLMEYLFSIGFHRDIMGEACHTKLKAYGYYDLLGFFQKYCLCSLECLSPFVTHILDAIDQARLDELIVQSQQQQAEAIVTDLLPLTVGTIVVYSLIFLVGVFGKHLVKQETEMEATN
jgi:hypothetical protein